MTDEARQTRYAPPAGGTRILLVRHGESLPARRGESFALRDGHGDPALHPDGEAQAVVVCARLERAGIAAIYVTTLQRTAQTAAPLARALLLEPRVEPDLREVHLGDWDGGAYRFHAAEGHPAFRRACARHDWGEIPGAETSAALQARVGAALGRIAGAHVDETVATFVHGGVIGAAMAVATGARGFEFNGAANGSISELVVQGDVFTVRRFNDCAHLE